MSDYVAIPLSREKLEDAYHGLVGMIEVFPPLLRKMNYQGQGKKDERECREHLTTARDAVLSMIAIYDGMEAGNDQD